MSQPTTGSLTCPKCSGEMRAYERNGVTVDQCVVCRGLFLDRGELEQLVDAESRYYQSADGRAAYESYPEPYRGRGDHHGGYSDHGRRKRRGFLGELFD